VLFLFITTYFCSLAMISKQSVALCIALAAVSNADSSCRQDDEKSLMQVTSPLAKRKDQQHLQTQSTALQEDGKRQAPSEGDAESRALTLYIAKVVIFGGFYGFVFGMMGAGGSLILKPLLYFAFDVSPFKITIFNAFSVLIALAGYGTALGHSKGKLVWQDVGRLGICVSGVGCVCGALLSSKVSDQAQLSFFGVLIVLAAAYMLLPKKNSPAEKSGGAPETMPSQLPEGTGLPPNKEEKSEERSMSIGMMAVGVAIGICSGFAGVGGGFMLVPLLTHMGHDMTTAVPTSQAVICFSSSAGFVWYGYLNGFGISQLHLLLCLGLTAVAMIGLYCSDMLGALLAQETRKRIFGVLLICTGLFTIATTPEVSGQLNRLHALGR